MQGGDEHGDGHEDSDGTKVGDEKDENDFGTKVMMSVLVLMQRQIEAGDARMMLIRKRWVVMLTVRE